MSARGFSMLELLVAIAIVSSILASSLTLMSSFQTAFERESERADMEQRLRAATEAVHRDLIAAGTGGSRRSWDGPLDFFIASVLPFRQGAQSADPPGTFKTDTLTVIYVPQTTSPQTTIREAIQAAPGAVSVDLRAGCPQGDAACGFAAGMDVMVYDATASFDTFKIESVQGNVLQLRHEMSDTTQVYAPGANIVEIVSHTYYLKADRAAGTSQLMRYDGSGSDAVLVDHVVGLTFQYYGDPNPPSLIRSTTDPVGPWTTYGPKPPPIDQQPTLYPAGENCAFVAEASGLGRTPRLSALGSGPAGTLVSLTDRQLTDGPWCPDDANPHRFDADLLRIRKVSVTLRVESAVSELRGPAGPLFTRGGTSRTVSRWLPDQEVRFEVSPRNLNHSR
jgi:prepilin-type N-terminal cleavage/methylation domain-containing protein